MSGERQGNSNGAGGAYNITRWLGPPSTDTSHVGSDWHARLLRPIDEFGRITLLTMINVEDYLAMRTENSRKSLTYLFFHY